MGASLALSAFSTAAARGLDGNPRSMLVRMALTALDSAENPEYWAGWEPLAEAIGHVLPVDDGTPEAARVRRAAREAVRTTMRRLIAEKIVSRAVRAAPGRNTRYALHLNRATMQAQPASMGTATMQAQPGNDAGSARLTMQAQPAPEEKTGDTEEETRASAPRPDPRCPRHRAVPHPPACHDCGRARRASEAHDAAEANAERARRRDTRQILHPDAVRSLADRFGGRYSPETITDAAREQMPDSLPVGLRIIEDLDDDDAAAILARWDR